MEKDKSSATCNSARTLPPIERKSNVNFEPAEPKKDFFTTQEPSQVDSPRSMNSMDNEMSREDYEVASDKIRAYLDRSVSRKDLDSP